MMMKIRGQELELLMEQDGTNVLVRDLHRKHDWLLDEKTRFVSKNIKRFDQAEYAYNKISNQGSRVALLGPGKATYQGTDSIIVTHNSPMGPVQLRWFMEKDRLNIYVEPIDKNGPDALTLPGTFRPADNKNFLSAIPNAQGVLHTGKGDSFYRPRWGMGVDGFAMAMFGQMTDIGGLLQITEEDADATLHWEKTDDGEILLMWRHEPSMGKLNYPRHIVIFATEPDLTCLCKQYRKYEIEKGRFRTWDEKIESRPNLSKLFGSALVFTGYPYDSETNYAEGLKKLKSLGINKALFYPVFQSYHPDAKDGDAYCSNSQRRSVLPLLKELGYLAGSFVYLDSTNPDPKGLKLDSTGNPYLYWELEGKSWYTPSNEKRLQYTENVINSDGHMDLDAIHFDILTCNPFVEDYSPLHTEDGRKEKQTRKEMLKLAVDKGLIVSSEGFWGRMTSYYDLCNTKFAHVLGGQEYCVVPMTMLVYHDSAYHTWWEVDNYNNPEHRSQDNRDYAYRYKWGGGYCAMQSAIDALMGTPPDIFPFGKMWNLIPHSRNSYSYRYSIDDATVRKAIEYAKPVMALNEKIGKLEMIEHKLHRPDGAIQESVFADGTRVIANFSNVHLESDGAGMLSPESWRLLS